MPRRLIWPGEGKPCWISLRGAWQQAHPEPRLREKLQVCGMCFCIALQSCSRLVAVPARTTSCTCEAAPWDRCTGPQSKLWVRGIWPDCWSCHRHVVACPCPVRRAWAAQHSSHASLLREQLCIGRLPASSVYASDRALLGSVSFSAL